MLVAGDNQVVIALVDTQSAAKGAKAPFDSHSLHLWNNDACKATADSGLNTGWDDKSKTPATADSFGPAWVVPLSKVEGCINFIARNGDLANLTGSDMKVIFSEHPDRTVAIVAGKKDLFGSRAEAFTAAFGVAGASAHLIDGNTLIWQGGKDKPHVRLYYTDSGTIKANADGVFDFPYVTLTATSLTAEQQAKYPHLKDAAAFALPAGKISSPCSRVNWWLSALMPTVSCRGNPGTERRSPRCALCPRGDQAELWRRGGGQPGDLPPLGADRQVGQAGPLQRQPPEEW